MPYAQVAARVLLGAVFIVAFAGKARSYSAFTAFADSLPDLGWLTRSGRRALAVAIPASEAAVVGLLAVPATIAWGFTAGLVLLCGLTFGASFAIMSGRRVECRCFGSTARPIGPAELGRNAILIVIALAGLMARIGSWHGSVSATGMTLAFGLGWLGALVIVGWDELGYLIGATRLAAGRP